MYSDHVHVYAHPDAGHKAVWWLGFMGLNVGDGKRHHCTTCFCLDMHTSDSAWNFVDIVCTRTYFHAKLESRTNVFCRCILLHAWYFMLHIILIVLMACCCGMALYLMEC